jgi:hypothetical protein
MMEFDPASYGQLAVFLAVVAMFLKHLHSLRVAQDAMERSRMEALGKIGEGCHAHADIREERMLEMLDRVSKRGERLAAVMSETTTMNGRVLQTLDRIDAQLEQSPAALNKAIAMVLHLDKRMVELEARGWPKS